jgi:hypothetical protein
MNMSLSSASLTPLLECAVSCFPRMVTAFTRAKVASSSSFGTLVRILLMAVHVVANVLVR